MPTEILRPLDALKHFSRGAAAYYLELTRSADPYLLVGAWRALLQGRQLANRPECWDALVEACRFHAVRSRAFNFFETEVFEHGYADHVAAVPTQSLAGALSDRMTAELTRDPHAWLHANGRAFLASGETPMLAHAQSYAQSLGLLTDSYPWLIRMLLLDPANAERHREVLEIFNIGAETALLAEYARLLRTYRIFPEIADLFSAGAAFHSGDYEGALQMLARGEGKTATGALACFRPLLFQTRANAEEKLGRFNDAYRDFVSMNAAETGPAADSESFYGRTSARRSLEIPDLPADPRPEMIQMLGFPRSGTTLLENALAAHPSVETFEETKALIAAIDTMDIFNEGRGDPSLTAVGGYLRARAKYYEEIGRLRRKPAATVLVDKLPLRSREAHFLGRLFPGWRYIFSIRHPFDVVLSCFKQRFASNPAMDNFRDFRNAVRAYDFTMSEWFGLHTLDDPAVHYVRYEGLVNDFEATLSGALRFLGLEWDEAVRNFAEAAKGRAAKTPSYQKVRKGIGLGVQTYWRNYRFVFDTPEAKPLHGWAEFFGYPTA